VNDWRDPLSADDPAAEERERRRAEREARRRARLAERVQTSSSADTAVAAAERPEPPQQPRPPEPRQQQAPPPPPPEEPTPPLEPAPQFPPPPPPTRPSRGAVHRRRLFALFGVLALAFVAVVIFVIAKQTGGSSEPAAPPPKALKTGNVVVPEGYRREQIADIAKKAGLEGDYMEASKSVKDFDPAKYGAENPENLEGFLFPATYEVFKNAKVEDLVGKQLDAFKQNMAGVDMGYAKSKNLTTYDVVIIASMVQAEAGNTDEMPQIAEVIYNRLSSGTPLGIDATIRYATGNYTKPLTDSELAIDSAYNTRVNAGLPPGPIGNPGLDAIQAAAKPAQGNLLFFVAKPGTCGHAFFETEEEFNNAVAEYNAARAANGGKSPTDC
jgi:hypothetical protein